MTNTQCYPCRVAAVGGYWVLGLISGQVSGQRPAPVSGQLELGIVGFPWGSKTGKKSGLPKNLYYIQMRASM
jgi:hypothetical protein